jgi:hypothetical protein
MKKRILRVLIAAGALCTPALLVAQISDASQPTMVNTGAMYVAPNANATTMLVTKSVVLEDGSDIYVAGKTEEDQNWATSGIADAKMAIGGSVYQEANDLSETTASNGFSIDANGFADGKGIVSFTDALNEDGTFGYQPMTVANGTTESKRRVIAPFADAYAADHTEISFDRAENYIAFPQIEINTTDKIIVPSRMGIDAKSVLLGPDATLSDKGGMWLESKADGTSIYDASMRIVGATGTVAEGVSPSSTLVTPGLVVVEREVGLYRGNNDVSTTLPNGELSTLGRMPFASPMENMRSGYFAGNMVREALVTDEATGHVQYVYADEPETGKAGDPIDPKYYLTNPYWDLFKTGTAYVIDLRPSPFDYKKLQGTPFTTADAHDIALFAFDGNVYNNVQGDKVVREQVFARDVLYESPAINTTSDKYINWAIGNSYTAGLDVHELWDAMAASPLNFRSQIYWYPNGKAQGYVSVNIGTTSDFNIEENFTQIPSQSTFILQLNKGKAQNATTERFKITKEMQSHGDVAHGAELAQGYVNTNEVLFTVTSEDTPGFYDKALLGFRPNANSDVLDDRDLGKQINNSNTVFQLYTPLEDGTKLAGNALSEGTERAPLAFQPTFAKADYTISTSRLESLNTEVLFLQDLKTQEMIDLRAEAAYTFTAEPGDNPNRFIVHFTRASAAGQDGKEGIVISYDNKERDVLIQSLTADDFGSLVIIANAQGRIVRNATIDQRGSQYIVDVDDLVDGVYIASVKGNNNAAQKFVVSPR